MQQSPLPRAAHAVHALLPMVPHEGQETLEAVGQPAYVQGVQVGRRERVLEFLCLVPGARAA